MRLFNKKTKEVNSKETIKVYLISINMHLFLSKQDDMAWFAKYTRCAGMLTKGFGMLMAYLTPEKQHEAYSIAKERYGENYVSLVNDIGIVKKEMVDYANALH